MKTLTLSRPIWPNIPLKEKPTVIFDLDGTIIDESVYKICATYVFRNFFDIYMSDEDYEEHFARKSYCHESTRLYLAKFGIAMTRQELDNLFNYIDDHYAFFLSKGMVDAYDEMINLLKAFEQQGYEICLVTGASKGVVDEVLRTLIPVNFKYVVTREDTFFGKPYPHPYNHCMEKLGIAPDACVIVENSCEGMHSASSSGAFVIGLENDFEDKSVLFKSGADCVLPSDLMTPDLISLLHQLHLSNRLQLQSNLSRLSMVS